jgi:hypothetical protein
MEMILLTRFFKYAPGASITRIQNEARGEGIKINLVRPTEIRLRERRAAGHVFTSVQYLNQSWQKIDLVLPMLRHDDTYAWHVVDELKSLGQRVVNIQRTPQGERAKMRRLCAALDLQSPESYVEERGFVWANRTTLPWPLIVRARLHTGERLAKWVPEWNALDDALHAYENVVEEPLYLIGARDLSGDHITTLLIGPNVVCALLKNAGVVQGNTLINAEQRGATSAVPLTVAEIEMLRKVRKIYGAAFVAIDFIRTANGPLVFDVNTAPVLKYYEDAAGQNFAKQVVRLYKTMVLGTKA